MSRPARPFEKHAAPARRTGMPADSRLLGGSAHRCCSRRREGGGQGLQLVTGVQWLNDMFNGVALLAAVAFAVWRQNAAQRITVPAAGEEIAQAPPAGIEDEHSMV